MFVGSIASIVLIEKVSCSFERPCVVPVKRCHWEYSQVLLEGDICFILLEKYIDFSARVESSKLCAWLRLFSSRKGLLSVGGDFHRPVFPSAHSA